MNRKFTNWAFGGLLLCMGNSFGDSLRFFARPTEPFEGDAVTFTYRTDVTGIVPLNQIVSWRWDFNGDGVWDEAKTVGEADGTTGLAVKAADINATWYAALDTRPLVDGKLPVSPKLEVTYKPTPASAPVTLVQDGITENTVGAEGVAPDPDTQIFIKDRSVGNGDISVNFTVNPRLAKGPQTSPAASPAETIRLYSSVKPADGKTLVSASYLWTITNRKSGAVTTSALANPQLVGLTMADGSTEDAYDVTLSSTYTVSYTNAQGLPATSHNTLSETKKDAFRVVSVLGELQQGRAYRRGFPETFGWEDIMEAYQALGPGNNRYVYFNHFENAFFDQQGRMVSEADQADPEKRRVMAEIVNELLQGQLLIANQRLIEALRIKYPRLAADVDEESDRLNPPAGAREETAAIDQALLDFELPIHYAGLALQLYGADVLRNKAPDGAEPYHQFPQYITFTDPTISQAPVPIKNEYWQLSTAFGQMCLGRVEKAKKLYRLSAQDSTALEEAKSEAKVTGLHSYLGMALLAAGQSERDYQTNEGNNLLAHQKNARDLFERINAGLNPLGNDGSFIPNESFAAVYQDAQEAVADSRESEINARQEKRTYEHYQAELRNEHLSQRTSYLTPLKNLTSIDPALYNDLRTVDDQRDYRAVVLGRVEALLSDYPNADPKILGELGSNVISVLDANQGLQRASNDVGNVFKRIDLAKWKNATLTRIQQEGSRDLLAVDLANIYIDQAFALASAPAATALGTTTGAKDPTSAILIALATPRKFLNTILASSIRDLQQIRVNNANLEAEIRGILLELGNLSSTLLRQPSIGRVPDGAGGGCLLLGGDGFSLSVAFFDAPEDFLLGGFAHKRPFHQFLHVGHG